LECCEALARSFIPSTASSPTFTSPAFRHNPSTPSNRSANARSCRRRNSAIVEWSGVARPAITMNATSSRHLRSISREDWIPFAYEYNNNATIIRGSYAGRP
jgi:hypothetical protein